MTSRNFHESEGMSCLQRENKKPTFYAQHFRYQRVYSLFSVSKRVHSVPTGIFSTNQRVYSVQTGIFRIKRYIQYQRVYSVSKSIFSIKGYIQYQRVYSVSKGIFSIKEYVQPKGIFSKKEYIHSVPMGTVHRCTIGLGNCWVKTIFFSKTLYLQIHLVIT